jgi:TatD DNase family protein
VLIDTHAHVNFKAFAEDADQTIRRALEAGVWVVNVGTQIDTSRQAVELAEKFEGLYAVVGLHPVHTYSQHLDEEESSFMTREEKFDYNAYFKLANNPKVVGIGECGLDYYRIKNEELGSKNVEAIKQSQKDAFIAQVKLATELNKALVIHCRPSLGSQDAYEDILQILDQEIHPSLSPSPNEGRAGERLRFEIHSFTGSPEIVQEFLKRGAYVGLNGIITFGDRKNKSSSTSADLSAAALAKAEALAKAGDKTGNMQKVVETVPLDRIVLETDSPYLTPVPHRGKRNEPLYVKHVAERVAELKNINVDEVSSQTTINARKLFNI